MSSKYVFASLGVLAVAAIVAGCPGELDDEARFRVDGGGTGDCTDAMQIFKASCLGSGCHNATEKFSDLDLETPGVVDRYNGVNAKGSSAHQLINPTDPSQSAIYTKTKSPAPFGLQMPMTGDKLTAAQQQCILTWITKELSSSPGPTDSGTTEDTGGASDAGTD